jgi:hypothetical protein
MTENILKSEYDVVIPTETFPTVQNYIDGLYTRHILASRA